MTAPDRGAVYLQLFSDRGSLRRDFGERYGLDIRYTCAALPSTIDPQVKLCVFRIVQEGLPNIVKHSGAKVAVIEVSRARDGLALALSDAGVGFDVNTASKHSGLGLISMGERLRSVGGTMSIDSSPNTGTRIRVEVPLAAHRAGESATRHGRVTTSVRC
jgi:signal transduction histidine kinase